MRLSMEIEISINIWHTDIDGGKSLCDLHSKSIYMSVTL